MELVSTSLRTLNVEEPAIVDLVGCGAVTEIYHAPVLRRLEKRAYVRVRYCIDREIDAARRLAHQFARAVPLDPTVASKRVEGAHVALIATPPEFHIEWILIYLSVGANVLVEKPGVTSLEEFRKVNEAMLKSKGRVFVGHFRRLYPSVLAARLAVDNGIIGELIHVDVYEGTRWGWPSRSRYPLESRWGGVILDTGSHALDMALFIMGLQKDSKDISFHIQRVEKDPVVEPSHEVRAELTLSNQDRFIPLSVSLSRRTALANVVRVCGSNGQLLVSTGFTTSACVRTKGKVLQLKYEQTNAAKSVEHAFHLEYNAVLGHPSAESTRNLLCFTNFALLTRVLEGLTTAERCP